MANVYEKIEMSMLPDEYLPDDYTGPSAGPAKQIVGNATRSYSGSGVLFVLKRVFVSFPFRSRFVYVAFRFLPFLRTFLTKNAFKISPIL